MDEIGFWGWVAVGAAVVLLLVGFSLTLWRHAQERRIDRMTDRLKRHLKPVPIEGRHASSTRSASDPTED